MSGLLNSKPLLSSPTISVVIPAYNAEEFLSEALHSVFAQTFSAHEVIVVDDGSADRTPEVVTGFGSKVTYIHKDRGGPASARNLGIRAASGDWIAFLDGDDLWLPTLLEHLVRASSHTDASLVFCDSQQLINGSVTGASRLETYGLKDRLGTLAPNGVLLDPFRLFLEERCYIFTPGVLIKRDALLNVGLFDESFYCGEDLDLWLRLATRHRFAVIDEVLHLRRVHGKNTGYNWWAKVRGDLQVYEKLEQYAVAALEDPILRSLVDAKVAHAYRDLGQLQIVRGEFAEARSSWSKSLYYLFSFMTGFYWLMTFLPHSLVKGALRFRKQVRSVIPRTSAPAIGTTSTMPSIGAARGASNPSS